MKKLLLLATLAIAIATGAALALAERAVHTPMAPGETATSELLVPEGMSGQALGLLLEKKGLIRDHRLWRYQLWRRGGLSAKAGRHLVSPGMSVAELATVLEGAPLPDDEPFVMIEGWRLRDTDAALAAQGLIEAGAYVEAASHPADFHAPFPLPKKTLEGYLYPETYAVVPDDFSVHDLIQRQLDTFVSRFWEPYHQEVARSGRTLRQIVIMASLLEREEPVPAQRALVAGILWKRIDHRQPLGVDATSRYLLPEWNDRQAFLANLHDRDDPWNTRTKVGLPPGPIGAPTVASLLSALHPKTSPYWYYLHDSNRVLHPSRNAREHEALRRKYHIY